MHRTTTRDSSPIDLWPAARGQANAPHLQRRVIVGAARAAEVARESGELVIRRGTLVARLLFVEGRIAWVHCHGLGGYLTDVIKERSGVPRAEMARSLDESRRSGTPLGEALVAGGWLQPQELRALLLAHVQAQLTALLDHDEPVAQLFLPVKRRYSGDYLFSVDELLGEHRAQLVGVPFLGPAALVATVARKLYAIEGAVGCGAVVTGHGREAIHEAHVEEAATPVEAAGIRGHAARVASEAALAIELPAEMVAVESVQVARSHYVYERRLATVTVFVIARAVEPMGAFIAAARAATRDLVA